ncbi:MAG: hypothetical protein HON48_22330 [Desulfobacula sp.]|jgi:hypothetical protein|nr:hypothetical protein [Desulfobacula sp.]
MMQPWAEIDQIRQALGLIAMVIGLLVTGLLIGAYFILIDLLKDDKKT